MLGDLDYPSTTWAASDKHLSSAVAAAAAASGHDEPVSPASPTPTPESENGDEDMQPPTSTEPAPAPAHEPTPESQPAPAPTPPREPTPPPPKVVKMSLKDFVLRKKRQRELEEKMELETGVKIVRADGSAQASPVVGEAVLGMEEGDRGLVNGTARAGAGEMEGVAGGGEVELDSPESPSPPPRSIKGEEDVDMDEPAPSMSLIAATRPDKQLSSVVHRDFAYTGMSLEPKTWKSPTPPAHPSTFSFGARTTSVDRTAPLFDGASWATKKEAIEHGIPSLSASPPERTTRPNLPLYPPVSKPDIYLPRSVSPINPDPRSQLSSPPQFTAYRPPHPILPSTIPTQHYRRPSTEEDGEIGEPSPPPYIPLPRAGTQYRTPSL
ncbi:hypothetical protein B0H34DRAFT_739106, partial [Crassisporium funariophilum]